MNLKTCLKAIKDVISLTSINHIDINMMKNKLRNYFKQCSVEKDLNFIENLSRSPKINKRFTFPRPSKADEKIFARFKRLFSPQQLFSLLSL